MAALGGARTSCRGGHRRGVACLGWHYLSNATCPIRPHSLFMRCLHSQGSPSFATLFTAFEETSVRQVVLDKWLPLSADGREVAKPEQHPSSGAGSGVRGAV